MHFLFASCDASLAEFFHCLLDLGDGLLADLLDLADRLVGPALRTQLVITGQRAGGFLDSPFDHICFATQGRSSFTLRLSGHSGLTLTYNTRWWSWNVVSATTSATIFNQTPGVLAAD